jgi:hypothetical protein
MIRVREHPKWASMASVLLVGEDDHSDYVGIWMVQSKDDEPDNVRLMVDPGVGKERITIATIPWAEKTIPFNITLTTSGTLTAIAAGRSKVVSLTGFSLRKVQLACSTAEVQFENVIITQP